MARVIWSVAAIGLLAGCAAHPVATTAAIAPGIAAAGGSFAVAPGPDALSKAAAPHVEARLRALGYVPSATPAMIVEVTGTVRPRAVGAYVPACGQPRWTEKAMKKWLAGGETLQALHLRILDAKTNAPLYIAAASVRGRTGSDAERAAALAAATLPADPRSAPAAAAPTGC